MPHGTSTFCMTPSNNSMAYKKVRLSRPRCFCGHIATPVYLQQKHQPQSTLSHRDTINGTGVAAATGTTSDATYYSNPHSFEDRQSSQRARTGQKQQVHWQEQFENEHDEGYRFEFDNDYYQNYSSPYFSNQSSIPGRRSNRQQQKSRMSTPLLTSNWVYECHFTSAQHGMVPPDYCAGCAHDQIEAEAHRLKKEHETTAELVKIAKTVQSWGEARGRWMTRTQPFEESWGEPPTGNLENYYNPYNIHDKRQNENGFIESQHSTLSGSAAGSSSSTEDLRNKGKAVDRGYRDNDTVDSGISHSSHYQITESPLNRSYQKITATTAWFDEGIDVVDLTRSTNTGVDAVHRQLKPSFSNTPPQASLAASKRSSIWEPATTTWSNVARSATVEDDPWSFIPTHNAAEAPIEDTNLMYKSEPNTIASTTPTIESQQLQPQQQQDNQWQLPRPGAAAPIQQSQIASSSHLSIDNVRPRTPPPENVDSDLDFHSSPSHSPSNRFNTDKLGRPFGSETKVCGFHMHALEWHKMQHLSDKDTVMLTKRAQCPIFNYSVTRWLYIEHMNKSKGTQKTEERDNKTRDYENKGSGDAKVKDNENDDDKEAWDPRIFSHLRKVPFNRIECNCGSFMVVAPYIPNTDDSGADQRPEHPYDLICPKKYAWQSQLDEGPYTENHSRRRTNTAPSGNISNHENHRDHKDHGHDCGRDCDHDINDKGDQNGRNDGDGTLNLSADTGTSRPPLSLEGLQLQDRIAPSKKELKHCNKVIRMSKAMFPARKQPVHQIIPNDDWLDRWFKPRTTVESYFIPQYPVDPKVKPILNKSSSRYPMDFSKPVCNRNIRPQRKWGHRVTFKAVDEIIKVREPYTETMDARSGPRHDRINGREEQGAEFYKWPIPEWCDLTIAEQILNAKNISGNEYDDPCWGEQSIKVLNRWGIQGIPQNLLEFSVAEATKDAQAYADQYEQKLQNRIALHKTRIRHIENDLKREQKRHAELVDSIMVMEQRVHDMPKCRICYERALSHAALPCHHLVMCGSCADLVQNCIVCRVRMTGTQRIYWG
ncbi:hypothetical protein BX616_004173 [Lobosporangium transversale]|uniref:RING-type domain-containing protein n=1 Tax=Lobosporangium transversale TaxID=64571 RepID=A0A1Y2GWK5_9FUNG|nr:hypothetical protein BCR41DRAFT_384269 [Lobosporangium transversale]KAF9916267.1 hypothetical protein BX616_004173 [Lobosporangium transversale]ORZ26686.1 hypothetical protein BCR41DRAFT_384269 [Lobosporangium transversale]|eukprot:XP_021884449.1 hypothetical protein BCR41DRAFT_384269 [Lobosporangium transversale]